MPSSFSAGASSISDKYIGKITKPSLRQASWTSFSFTRSMSLPVSMLRNSLSNRNPFPAAADAECHRARHFSYGFGRFRVVGCECGRVWAQVSGA